MCFSIRHWVTELQKAERKPEYKPSLAKAIVRSFGPFYLSLGIFTFIEECFIRIFQPLFMGKILLNRMTGRLYLCRLDD